MTELALDKSLKQIALLDSEAEIRASRTMQEVVAVLKGLLNEPVLESDIIDTFVACKPISMTALPSAKKGEFKLGVYIKNIFRTVKPLVTLDTAKDQKGDVINRLIAQLDGSQYTLSFYTDLNPTANSRQVAAAVINDKIVEGMFVPPPLLVLPAGGHTITAIVLGEKTDVLTVKIANVDTRVRVQKSGLKVGSIVTSENDQLFEGESAVAISFSSGNLIDFVFVEGEVYKFSNFAKLGASAITCSVITSDGTSALTWCPRKFPVNDIPRGRVLTYVAKKVTAGVGKTGKPNQAIEWGKP